MTSIPDYIMAELHQTNVAMSLRGLVLISGISGGGTLSGVVAYFLSGVNAVNVSATIMDLSGLTVDLLSGIQGSFNSGVTTVTYSGTTADLSGATIDVVSGVLGSFSSGITVLSGTPSTTTLTSGYWVVALTSAAGTPKVYMNYSGVIWSVALASGV